MDAVRGGALIALRLARRLALPCALAFASGAWSVSFAQEPAKPDSAAAAEDPHAVQPERPTVATHAGTVAPGWLEVESGVERDRTPFSYNSYLTPTVAKIGLASHVQLGLFGGYDRPAVGVSGVSDVGADIKWRLVDDAPVVGDFALLPSIKFPTGDAAKGTGTGTTDIGLLAISSHDFGPVSVDINVGYTHRSGNGFDAPTSATLWTISAGGPVAGGLGWTAEVYGYPGTGGPAGQAPIVAFLGGPTFLARPWLAFDTGFITKLTGPQPDALYAGVVYNIGRLWGRDR